MVVRELVGLLGIKTDKASIQKAESTFSKMRNTMLKVAAAAASIFVAIKGGLAVLGLASDANETLNVLDASFGRSKEAVLEWADAFAEGAGRSRFAMRDLAGQLGAVLNPLMDENQEAAAQMSTRLAELAVDLGSFFNAAEPDTLRALRSAVTGEAEAIKKFGVVMNTTTLEAFALEQGITKSFKSMTIAEKTALRYNFILDQTKTAHGDAAKTAGGWANATKTAAARLKDIGTTLGLKFLPMAEEAVKTFIRWAPTIERVVMGLGRFLMTVIKTAGWILKLAFNLPVPAKLILIAAAFAKWGKALKFLLSPFGKFMIMVALLILIIDDLRAFMEGGDSVFGDLFKALDDLTGIDVSGGMRNVLEWFKEFGEDPVRATERIFEKFGELKKELEDFSGPTAAVIGYFDILREGALALFLTFIEPIRFLIDAFTVGIPQAWQNSLQRMGELWDSFVILLIDIFRNVFGVELRDEWEGLKDWFSESLDGLLKVFDNIWKRIATSFRINLLNPLSEAWESFKKTTIGGAIASTIEGLGMTPTERRERDEQARVNPRGFSVEDLLPGGDFSFPMSVQGPPAAAGFSTLRGGGGQTVNDNSRTNVNVEVKAGPGMDEKRLGVEVGNQVKKAMEKQNSQALRALVPQAE